MKAVTKLVSGIIIKKQQILLGLRINTQHFSNYWSLPVGHVETAESSLQAIKRELGEEIGVEVTNAIPFCVKTDNVESIFHQVYVVKGWDGSIVNREPHLCSDLRWFSLHGLPDNLTPISKEIIDDFKKSDIKLSFT